MTATDPRPQLATMLAARFTPAAPDRGSLSPRRRGGQAPAAEIVLHRLRWRREPWSDPSSEAGATVGAWTPAWMS